MLSSPPDAGGEPFLPTYDVMAAASAVWKLGSAVIAFAIVSVITLGGGGAAAAAFALCTVVVAERRRLAEVTGEVQTTRRRRRIRSPVVSVIEGESGPRRATGRLRFADDEAGVCNVHKQIKPRGE